MTENTKNSLLKNLLFALVIFACGALAYKAYNTYLVSKEVQMNFKEVPDPLYATPEQLKKLFLSGLTDEAKGCGFSDFKSLKERINLTNQPISSYAVKLLMLDPKSDECLEIKKKRDIYDAEKRQAIALQESAMSK